MSLCRPGWTDANDKEVPTGGPGKDKLVDEVVERSQCQRAYVRTGCGPAPSRCRRAGSGWGRGASLRSPHGRNRQVRGLCGGAAQFGVGL